MNIQKAIKKAAKPNHQEENNVCELETGVIKKAPRLSIKKQEGLAPAAFRKTGLSKASVKPRPLGLGI